MLLNSNQINLIKDNKVSFVNNFLSLERKYDFNLISILLEENELKVSQKTTIGNLKDVFQIKNVSNSLKEFKTFFDFFSKLFKYSFHEKDEIDLFFSFVAQAGNPHIDTEDVFIIGLHGKTIYRIFDKENKDYEINKGDLIFIPKGTKHKVIGINPRVIASIGFYGNRYK